MRNLISFGLLAILFICSKSSAESNPESQLRPSYSLHGQNNSSLSDKDTMISRVINEVNSDSIKSYMLMLESFNTRYYSAPNRYSVVQWIINKFRSFGYSEVYADSFLNQGIWCKNITATLNSNSTQKEILIAGAHYDSENYTLSPGADDNASGVSAVLEMARILKHSGVNLPRIIKFIAFDCEEAGLVGSMDIAKKFRESGQEIGLMINLDMIANASDTCRYLKIYSYKGLEPYHQLSDIITKNYTTLEPINLYDYHGRSDSYSFNYYGYPSIYFEENEINIDRYHSSGDSTSYCNIPYTKEVAKAAFANLLQYTFLPSPVKNLSAANIGDGQSIRLKWAKSNESGFYRIYIGKNSYIYDSSITASDTNIVITGLAEGSTYYFGAAITSNNFESVINEVAIIPGHTPLAPHNFKDDPQKDKIVLYWQKNTEEDLRGYNLYRSIDTANGFIKINTEAINDTLYSDKERTDTSYYYYVTGIDINGNESNRSNVLKSHAVTLNHGLLIVDDSDEITGDKYTDSQIDSFYISLLTDRKVSSYDLVKLRSIKLSDLGMYTTVIWHNDSYISSPKYIDELGKYLDYGGTLLYTGSNVYDFKPHKAYEIPYDYTENDFIYKYLKIKHLYNAGFSEFIGAVSANDSYRSVVIDPSKNPSGYLTKVEALQPAPGGSVVLTYDSKYNDDTYGKLKGQPVGIEYIGNDYKAVVLSFPLFYMSLNEAKDLINYIINDRFGNGTEVHNSHNIVGKYWLYQNYPNPFNPETRIKYDIPEPSYIELKVYDILGRSISTLYSGFRKSGRYEALFDGSNLPSGIYVYQLRSANYMTSRKFLLLK
ncbi:MAG: M20/M25/M40 family metallo-hydrolase [Ignavibacteria bacterium]|jgi:hypothetical protein|nr:M20/M25/M40 family metallo-hydrolase [Ignavibacteria bacterium]MCU7500611.1 M20/M25/M40 family metallo-hydrolase [Ignavibacteria bacterium]MCU7514622.1 M20/M25/M40 family metallo-hydrolase [Ignavibacteria bacterium]MCU7520808.1 M20/M25/M40 family metallo-hydrolase [Ignavibacteria bacterium]MCU7526528.1 M20/M25/M40 family metallo-hydrolase [Ignavibacteria bacterium]